jgi:hypothetical protein
MAWRKRRYAEKIKALLEGAKEGRAQITELLVASDSRGPAG